MSDESTPRAHGDDSADERPTGNGAELSRARQRLASVLQAMHRADGPDDDNFQRARGAAKTEAGRVAVVLAAELSATPEDDYGTRIGLIQAAAQIQEPAMLPLLTETALAPMPTEKSENPHSFSTVAEETIIKTTAVDGVAALAADGSGEAVDALFEFLATTSFSVRRAAVSGLLAAPGGREYRSQIADALPKEQRFLLDLARTSDPQRMLQPDPEATLSDAGRRSRKPAAPRLADGTASSRNEPPHSGSGEQGEA